MSEVLCGIVVHETPPPKVERLLESLKASLTPVDVVLLCNSKREAQNASMGALATRYGAWSWLRRPNAGFGAAHNEIVREFARGHEWYVCCNPDVEVDAHCIRELVNAGRACSDAVVLAPVVLNSDGSLQPVIRRHPTLRRWIARQLSRLFGEVASEVQIQPPGSGYTRTEFVSGCFFALRIAQYRKLGGFDEDFFLYYEDADLSRRAQSLGFNYIVASARVTHDWGRAWKRSPRMAWIQLTNYCRYLSKHGLG